MLNSILIGPTRGLLLALQGMCAELKEIFVYKILESYPHSVDLGRLLNVFDPEVVLLEIIPGERGLEVAEGLRLARPDAVVIGFTRQCDRAYLARAAQLGITEVLIAPFGMDDLQRALVKSFEARSAGIFKNLIGFIPAKPGSGASTTAVHVAAALAGPLHKKVLLIDGDRRSGVLAVRLNREPVHTLFEALEHSHELDDGMWSYWNLQTESFDLLPMPRLPGSETFPPWCYQRLLRFVSARYDTVILDLPDVADQGMEALARQAKNLYLLCTPEPASVFLAWRRIQEFQAQGLKEDRLSVVVNRCPPKEEGAVLSVEKELGMRVTASLPDDPAALRDAAFSASLVAERSAAGQAFTVFARSLAGLPPPLDPSPVPQSGLRSLFRKRLTQ